jgi:hypothetical protein
MSYIQRKALSGISDYVDRGVTALTAAKTILEDPALMEVSGLVLKLHNMQPPPKPGSKPAPGIGLKDVVPPLRAYVKFKENPVIGYAIVGAILGAPFLLGYALGKRR